ncbi:SpoIIE family protein phosphatase [Eisenibacter elegans]|uniref:SpoIIE family protein phosphatase n=1 Tax=Eisenibacter elegans TaxID=997 RepID=UPI0004235238|nr:SpoIIE family protein phosphatase [Eisenibacter elegans]
MHRNLTLSFFASAFGVFMLLCVFAVDAFGQQTEGTWRSVSEKKQGTLIVIYNEDDPFVYRQGNDLAGIEYELLQAFVAFVREKYQTNLTLQWELIEDFQAFYETVKTASTNTIGTGAVTITEARRKEVKFTAPYLPDIEVIISNAAVPLISDEEAFLRRLPELQAVTLEGSTFEKHLQQMQQGFAPDLTYKLVANSEEMLRLIGTKPNYWGYLQLPTYLLQLKKGANIRRHPVFSRRNEGLAFFMPLNSDWDEPLNAFLNSRDFGLAIRRIISNYIGEDSNELLSNIANDSSGSKEVEMLKMEGQMSRFILQQKDIELNRQSLYISIYTVAIAFTLIIVGVLFFMFRLRNQANRTLKDKNKEIAQQAETLKETNNNLTLLGSIGRSITTNLSLERIAESVYVNLRDLMDVDEVAIGVYDAENKVLNYELYFYEGTKVPGFKVKVTDSQRFSNYCVLNKAEIFLTDIQAQYSRFFTDLDAYKPGDLLNAIICLPLIDGEQVIGLISVQSKQTGAYTDYHLNLLRNIAIYTTIALKNAQAYKQINQQKAEIETQKLEIERNNEHITASIRAAQVIQQGLLPFESRMRETFRDYFAIYLPKDIVSGDFYWVSQIGTQRFVAVIDCTGHGVPGAFMSMIAYALLNEIVNTNEIFDPATVLEELDRQVQMALSQGVGQTGHREGMDISFCTLSPAVDNPTHIHIRFAGAKQPLYYTQGGHLHRIDGIRRSIGSIRTADEYPFENNELVLAPDDMLFLATDGYMDAPDDKRHSLGKSQFELLLKVITPIPTDEQRHCLLHFLEQHSRGQEQRDDITVLGIRL